MIHPGDRSLVLVSQPCPHHCQTLVSSLVSFSRCFEIPVSRTDGNSRSSSSSSSSTTTTTSNNNNNNDNNNNNNNKKNKNKNKKNTSLGTWCTTQTFLSNTTTT